MKIGLIYRRYYKLNNYKNVIYIFREVSNTVVHSDPETLVKNNAAKPPIPTKIHVTNGNKGEWTSENDNLNETLQVRSKYLF